MTIQERLKARGFSDKQIADIVAAGGDAIGKFDEIFAEADTKATEADRKLAEATASESRVKDWWDKDATKQINEVHSKNATLEAERNFYKTQAEKAKESGFLPADAPGFKAGTNEVPGSPAPVKPGDPKYMTQDEGYKALTTATWVVSEYMRLNGGAPPPDDLETLVAEANGKRMKVRDYVEQKYDFGKRRTEIAAAKQKDHDDKIAKDAADAVRKEYADKANNPDLRPQVASQFSKFTKGEQGKSDRLSWSQPDAKERMRQSARETANKELVH
jgi:hypothetical protein